MVDSATMRPGRVKNKNTINYANNTLDLTPTPAGICAAARAGDVAAIEAILAEKPLTNKETRRRTEVIMNAHETQLDTLRETLRTENDDAIKAECKSSLESGIDHKDIVRVILRRITDCSVADPSWLPAASFINLFDSLVHVALQAPEDKHKLIVTGERSPKFRRIESPPPVTGSIDEVTCRFAEATDGNDCQLGERCLLGIADQADIKAVFATTLECLLQPRFLGVTSGPWWAGVRHLSVGCLIDLWQQFGDEAVVAVICHFGAKQCAKMVDRPSDQTQHAIDVLEQEFSKLESVPRGTGSNEHFDEEAFRTQLSAGNVETVFAAITDAWQAGVSIDTLHLAMTMHCVERLQRAGHGSGANWDNLKRELMSTSVMRQAKVIDEQLAIKAAYHAAWQWVRHGEEGLADQMPVAKACPIPNEGEQIGYVIDQIGHSVAPRAMRQANNFIAGGHNGEELLQRLILYINSDGVGGGYFNGQRGMIDAWYVAENHPQRNHILVALAGWAADYRNQHLNHTVRYGAIWGANLSADGRLLAIVSAGTRVFDTTNGKELMYFRGFPWRFAFHPNSRLLASGWDGGQLQIWDLVARELVTQFDAFPDDVSGQFGEGKFWGMEFSPDGTMLAGCSRGCSEVKVWNTSSWDLQFQLVGHTHDRNESVTFSADSKTIVTGGNDGTVRVWDADDGKQRLVFDGHTDKRGRMTAVDFHPNGKKVLSVESEGEIKVWDWKTGEVLATADGKGYCNFAGFTLDGKIIVSEHEGALHYWNADTGELLERIRAIPNEGMHAIFGGANQSRDRSTIVTAGWYGQIRIWNAVTHKEANSFGIEF